MLHTLTKSDILNPRGNYQSIRQSLSSHLVHISEYILQPLRAGVSCICSGAGKVCLLVEQNLLDKERDPADDGSLDLSRSIFARSLENSRIDYGWDCGKHEYFQSIDLSRFQPFVLCLHRNLPIPIWKCYTFESNRICIIKYWIEMLNYWRRS